MSCSRDADGQMKVDGRRGRQDADKQVRVEVQSFLLFIEQLELVRGAQRRKQLCLRILMMENNEVKVLNTHSGAEAAI